MQQIQIFLDKNNIQQKELAKILGVTPAAVNKYIKGIAEPNIKSLIKLSELFNCSIDELVGNEKRTSTTTSPTKQRALDIFNQLADNDYLVLIGYMEHLLLEKEQKRKQRINGLIDDINREV